MQHPIQDHHQAVSVAIRKPPPDWRRPVGRPRHTWLRVKESNLRPLNTDLFSAWRKAAWRSIMDMATLKTSLQEFERRRRRRSHNFRGAGNMCVNDWARVATRQCDGRESNSRPADRKFSLLSTTLPSHNFITTHAEASYMDIYHAEEVMTSPVSVRLSVNRITQNY